MSKVDEMLNKDEIDCCKEELKNYIEFMESAGDNAGWARGLKWYIDRLEKQLADSTPNSVIREKIADLKLSSGSKGKDEIENQIRELTTEILEEIVEGRREVR